MTDRLSWLELSKLAPGTRVGFVEAFGEYPNLRFEPGEMATVTENGLNAWGGFLVLPDNPILRDHYRDWDGQIDVAAYADLDPAGGPAWDEPSPLALAPIIGLQFFQDDLADRVRS